MMDALEQARDIVRGVGGGGNVEDAIAVLREENLKSVLIIGFKRDGSFFSSMHSSEGDCISHWIGLLTDYVHDLHHQLNDAQDKS